jgi:outer membrane protein assembly factor BamB
MTLWNSTNVPFLYRNPDPNAANFPYYWAQWEPYGKTVNGTGPFPITPNTENELPTGFAGYMWNVTIPKDLPGAVCKVRDGIILGSNLAGNTPAPETIRFWAISTEPGNKGTLIFDKSYSRLPGNLTMQIRDASVEEGVFVVSVKETRQWYAYDLTTGDKLWGPSEPPQPTLDWVGFSQSNWVDLIAYDKLYSGAWSGVLHAYNINTGEILWNYTAVDEYSESLMGPNWVFGIFFIADGKIYLGHFEHSSFDPLPRGSPTICLDAETGEEIWKIDIRTGNNMGAGSFCMPIIGDGVMVIQNSYDMNDYAIGKGPSKTTVSIQNDVITKGNRVVVTGSVTDISPGTSEYALSARFPEGVPAVSDDSMSKWMQYVYMQYPRPTDVMGVTVKLEAVDPNNNYQNLGTAITDSYGHYGFNFEPEVPGQYMIIASFEGSEAYYGSASTTYLFVNPASSPATPIEPEQPATEAPLITTEVAILMAVALIAVIGVALFLFLRRRQ